MGADFCVMVLIFSNKFCVSGVDLTNLLGSARWFLGVIIRTSRSFFLFRILRHILGRFIPVVGICES